MLMSLAGCLAALLLDGPAHGYQLKATLEAELGPLWVTRASQVYVTLRHMAADGLVSTQRIRQETRPDRLLLAPTTKGRELAERWLFEPGDADEIVVRLAVARLVIPERFAELLTVIEHERSSALRQLRDVRARVHQGFQREVVDAEIGRVQAQLHWVSSLHERSAELIARPRATRHSLAAAEPAAHVE